MKKSFDMDPREFARQQRAEESRFILDQLRKNESSESHDPVGELTADYAHVTDSTSFLLVWCECPPEFRGFLDALVGLAGYRAKTGEWFWASDRAIADRAGRCKKWVQNQRKEFLKWQNQSDFAMVDIEDNNYNDGHPIPHKYRVNIAAIAAESTLNARLSPKWHVNPGQALQEAAKIIRDSIPTTPIHKRYKKSSRQDAEKRIESALAFALTKMRKARQTNEHTGNRIGLNAKMLESIEGINSELNALKRVHSTSSGATQP